MSTLRSALAALVLVVLALPAGAMPAYSTMYVFGDSLSDNGNLFAATSVVLPTPIPDPAHYYQGRFTDGLNYAERLWQMLALPGGLTPYYASATGTNYAVGGARSRYSALDLDTKGLPPAVGNAATQFSLMDQVTRYQANPNTTSDPNALYLFWLGSNDLFDILAVGSAYDLTAAGALMVQSLADIEWSFASLVASGARHFLLPSLPDIGLTPEILAREAGSPGIGVKASGLAQTFNDFLNAYFDTFLGVPGIDLIRFDGFGFLHDAVTNQEAFGFTNVTDACLTGFFVAGPTTGDVKTCATPESYLFWDQIHPSARGHELLAAAMYEAVPEPMPLAMLMTGLTLLWWSVRTRRNGQAPVLIPVRVQPVGQ